MTVSGRQPDPSRVPWAPNPPRKRLTARELGIALLIADGLNEAEIAGRLGVARSTVVTHLQHIRFRLGLKDRAGIIAWVTARRSSAAQGASHGRAGAINRAENDQPPRDGESGGRCVECGRDLRGREHLRIDRSGGAGTDANRAVRACSWQCLAVLAWTQYFND